MATQTDLLHPHDGLFAWPVRYEIPSFRRRYVWQQTAQREPFPVLPCCPVEQVVWPCPLPSCVCPVEFRVDNCVLMTRYEVV